MKTKHSTMVISLCKDGSEIKKSLTSNKTHVWHMASCIMGEGGELFDAIKKWVIYEQKLDRANIVEELGDIEFYLDGLRHGLNITRAECLEANIKKLAKRYKDFTYSNKAAKVRKDKQ